MKIIDGYTGSPHVTSLEVAAYNQGLQGEGDSVLGLLDQFSATEISATQIDIGTGIATVGGIRCGNITQSESVAIDAGTVGAWRHDLICIRYNKDADTLVESCDLVVLKGENGTQTTAADPTPTQEDLLDGATLREFPLYRVILDGTNIDSITPLFTPIMNLDAIQTALTSHVDHVTWEGTDANGWRIRRWASGFMEAWQYVKGLTYGSYETLNGVRRHTATNAPAAPDGMIIQGVLASAQNSGAWAMAGFTTDKINIFSYIITGTTVVQSMPVYVWGIRNVA